MTRATSLKLCCALLTLAACSGEMSLEDARQEAVVTVAGVELDGATLERVLLEAPERSPGPSRETASVVVAAFIDAALLRQALVRGVSFSDSALVHEAITPDAMRGQILELLQQRAAAMPEVTDEQADSLGRLGSVRVFQHILVRLVDATDTVAMAGVRGRVAEIVQALDAPDADFSAIARRYSQDTVTAANGGYVPPRQRQELPAEMGFADRVWALSPGDVSRPILSRQGVHLVRRATLVEGRPGFRMWLRPALTRLADSIWVDSLARAKGVSQASDAIARLRAMSIEPFSGGGDAPFATWQGGELTAAETRMWLSVLPVGERVALPTAPDSAITLFIDQLAERDVVAGYASPGGQVTPRAFEALAPQFTAAMTSVSEQYRDALVVGDSTTALREFLVSISMGQRPYRPLPGAMAGILRRDASITLNQDAIDAIVRGASRQWQLEYGIDSTAADSGAVPTDSAGAISP